MNFTSVCGYRLSLISMNIIIIGIAQV